MNALRTALIRSPLVYVTRDIERALGLPLDTPGYYIITNFTPFANEMAKGRKNILLIDSPDLLDTWELLGHPATIAWLNSQALTNILVFKPTKQIETICTGHGWNLLNPSASLAAKLEEKITQLTFLPSLRPLFPPYEIAEAGAISRTEYPFVVQFNHSHTGSGTMLISNETELKSLQQKFPQRPVRVAPYIAGPLFTNNNVVTDKTILVGNISYQITGLPPFTDNQFATIGNDWGLVKRLLTEAKQTEYRAIATRVGRTLQQLGWRGLFGIDVIFEPKSDKLYLLEINARQPQSAAWESELQRNKKQGARSNSAVTIFEAHLATLMEKDISGQSLIEIDDGAQVILRSGNRLSPIAYRLSTIEKLSALGFTVILYPNTAPSADRMRIQSLTALMADHNTFNMLGQKIVSLLL